MADPPIQGIQFTLGVTPEGRVMVNFDGKMIDHLLLTDMEALNMAEGLVEAARMVDAGRGGILRVR